MRFQSPASTAALLLLPALSASALANNVIFDTLSAQGLLGSHFGAIPQPGVYDYVVVGGGTAGLAIARRLAANASYTVAVIEAGGFSEFDNGNSSQIPGMAGAGIGSSPEGVNPLIDWQFVTEPQAGLDGRTSAYAQGKTLGGGSTRNSMWYHRASKGSYQQWATQVDDDTYTFDKFLPYLERSVNFTPPTRFSRPANATAKYAPDAFSDKGGPLHVSYSKWVTAIASWFAKSLTQLGLPEVRGFQDGDLLGWAYIAVTVDPDTETRSSSETSFLREALVQTTNMNVYKSTIARSIIFNDKKQATGVVVDTAGAVYNITANKEVIVSSGVFRSPQLLMVSGVGPAKTLEANNVTVLADRPGVGQNMWDHLLFGPSFPVNVPTLSALTNDPKYAIAQAAEYAANRSGVLTNVGGDLLAFLKTPPGSVPPKTQDDLNKAFASDWPNIELLTVNGYAGSFRDEETDSPPPNGINYASLAAALVSPFSRGNVTINSTDTRKNPVISPNWLLDPRDQDVAVAAYRFARSVFETSSIAQGVVGPESFPAPDVTSYDQLLETVRNNSLTVYHAAATNAMGKSGDPMAVVDSKCRVYGVDKLRVVDASAFPFLPPGHPQGTVYALAEKIADDILCGR